MWKVQDYKIEKDRFIERESYDLKIYNKILQIKDFNSYENGIVPFFHQLLEGPINNME